MHSLAALGTLPGNTWEVHSFGTLNHGANPDLCLWLALSRYLGQTWFPLGQLVQGVNVFVGFGP